MSESGPITSSGRGVARGRYGRRWRGRRGDAAHRLRHQHLAQARDRQEALGAGVEQPHLRQVGAPPVGQHPGQPFGAEPGVEVAQRPDLEERVQQADHPPGHALAGGERDVAGEQPPPHREVHRQPGHPTPAQRLRGRGDEELGHPVGRVGIVPHEVERVAERGPIGGHDPQEAARRAALVQCHAQEELGVRTGADDVLRQRHREPAPRASSPATGR